MPTLSAALVPQKTRDERMLVRTQSRDGRITGLYIGAANARRHFSRAVRCVDLELGHLHIQCELQPGFWNGSPEIRDPRLADWLEARHLRPRNKSDSIELEMTRTGDASFHLEPAAVRPCHVTGLPCPVDSCESCPVDRLRVE